MSQKLEPMEIECKHKDKGCKGIYLCLNGKVFDMKVEHHPECKTKKALDKKPKEGKNENSR